jgi:hypothetical protein
MPHSTAGSLGPAFATARPVGLAVRPAYALALCPAIAKRGEPTFELLRYILGGNRPSQTDRLAGSRRRIHALRLENQTSKGGISQAAPPRLAPELQSFPPILHMDAQPPVPGYSKGSWGLSVLPQVSGIFTGTTTSPGSTLRQRPDRYTIRAGRNLPDKEFRYLRTVIVTADIHRGFTSGLRLAADPSA